MRSSRAAVSGSVGTLKGSLARMSTRSARPGTSTPSQNESVPRRIAEPASRKRRSSWSRCPSPCTSSGHRPPSSPRSEEHTSELQSRLHLVCRLLLEKKKQQSNPIDADRLTREKHLIVLHNTQIMTLQ